MERSEQQRDEILQMWDGGHSASQIAEAIGGGLTRSAVCGLVYRARAAGVAVARSGQPKHALAPRSSRPYGMVLGANAERTPPRLPKPDLVAPAPRLAADGKPIGTLALSVRDCRWPYGEPRAADFHYCAQPKSEDQPYCAYHAARSRTKKRENDDED